jgi:H+/Cl- antiporter ClcA
MVNHIPLVGTLFGVALLAFGLKRNSDELKLASLCTFIFVSGVALLTFFTGESAEDMLKNAPGVAKDLEKYIHPHEEAALFFLVTSVIAGILSAFAMFTYGKSKTFKPTLLKDLLVVSIFALLIAGRTAQLGGQIRHTEVRSASTGGVAEANDEDDLNDTETENGMPEPSNSSK